jgi:hypothetical protein
MTGLVFKYEKHGYCSENREIKLQNEQHLVKNKTNMRHRVLKIQQMMLLLLLPKYRVIHKSLQNF